MSGRATSEPDRSHQEPQPRPSRASTPAEEAPRTPTRSERFREAHERVLRDHAGTFRRLAR